MRLTISCVGQRPIAVLLEVVERDVGEVGQHIVAGVAALLLEVRVDVLLELHALFGDVHLLVRREPP